MASFSAQVTPPTLDTSAELTLIHDEQVVAELQRLGVDHLTRLRPEVEAVPITPVALLVALAEHREARLRSALILLFLRQPKFAEVVREAIEQADSGAANNLRLYYQAALYLQTEIQAALKAYLPEWQPLPDLFSVELGLPAPSSVKTYSGLEALGELHRQLSGWSYNWAGSYWQNIDRFVTHLKQLHLEQLNA